MSPATVCILPRVEGIKLRDCSLPSSRAIPQRRPGICIHRLPDNRLSATRFWRVMTDRISRSTSPRRLRLLCAFAILGAASAAAQTFTVTPSSIAYPKENVGLQSACQPVVVTNTGTTNLTVTGFALTPFMVFQLQYGYAPKTLIPKQTSTYCIKFVPQAAQAYTGQISITIAGVSNPAVVAFTGTGTTTTATASVTPNTLTFAPQPLGTTTSQTVTVMNTGHAAFHLSSVTGEPP